MLAIGGCLIALGVLGTRLAHAHAWVVLWDNVHWTSAYLAGATLAWMGRAATSEPQDRRSRTWFAAGLTAYAVGQLLWDAQVFAGWNPFPGPSDGGFLLLGVLVAGGFASLLRGRLTPAERWAVLLDSAMIAAASLTFTLALYLPRRGAHDAFTTAVLVAYPVVLFTALGLGVVAMLALRVRPAPLNLVLLVALLGTGLIWAEWNSLTLDDALGDGVAFNYTFSVLAPLLGLGAAGWTAQPSTDAGWDRRCAGALRLLPLLLVLGSAVAIIAGRRLGPGVEAAADLGTVTIVLLAIIRQSLLLRERDVLLAAEQALRASELERHVSEQQLREVVSASGDAIFLVGVEDHGTFRILDINPAGAHASGITRSAAAGRRLEDVYPPEMARGFAAHYAACLEADGPVSYEESVPGTDGVAWFATSLAPIRDASGRIRRIAGVARNITAQRAAADERLRLQEELERRVAERTAELAAANDELNSFAYSVSHDLRAPLRAIDGFSLILDEEQSASLGPEGRRHLERIRAATRRMARLIDDLLTLSKVTRQSLDRKRCDVTALALSVIDELRASEPGREVSVEVAPGLVAEADEGLLRIALENLLGNAWKFTRKTPAARITLRCESRDGEQCFVIADNGAGFDMAYVGRLFGAFQRLHAERDFEGTGIGLATVQRVLVRHRGRVWAEAKPGEGATFHFTLPE